jgi:hypothetical protein
MEARALVLSSIFAAIFALVVTQLIYVWVRKDMGFGAENREVNSKFNERIWWSSFAVFFGLGVFIIPCYFGESMCRKLKI